MDAYLWTGSEFRYYSAKVKWMHICAPKAEEGLGFRNLREWNKATMLRQPLWALSKKADSLWVKWVHTCVIKGKCLPTEASWTVRKFFELRAVGQPLINISLVMGLLHFRDLIIGIPWVL